MREAIVAAILNEGAWLTWSMGQGFLLVLVVIYQRRGALSDRLDSGWVDDRSGCACGKSRLVRRLTCLLGQRSDVRAVPRHGVRNA
jgi:hypothetical protein